MSKLPEQLWELLSHLKRSSAAGLGHSVLFPNNLEQEVQPEAGNTAWHLEDFSKGFLFLAKEKLNKLILPIFGASGASPAFLCQGAFLAFNSSQISICGWIQRLQQRLKPVLE